MPAKLRIFLIRSFYRDACIEV